MLQPPSFQLLHFDLRRVEVADAHYYTGITYLVAVTTALCRPVLCH